MAKQSVFGKLCDRTVCHGIPDWYQSKKTLHKIAWSLILLGALTFIVYYSCQMISIYLRNETATKISSFRLSNISFPNVTVCHGGRFNKTFIEGKIQLPPEPLPTGYDDRKIKIEFLKYFSALAYQSVSFDPQVKDYLRKTYEYNFDKNKDAKAYDIQRFINDAAFQCNNQTFFCGFALKKFECCDVARQVLSDYGVCYHMQIKNRDPNQTGQAMQLAAGPAAGLIVGIRLSKDDLLSNDNGLRVHFGSYLEPNDYSAVRTLPNTDTVIRMKLKKTVVNPEVRFCTSNSIPLAYQETYTEGLCRNECQGNVSMKYCDCMPAGYLARIQSSEVCSPQQMLNCLLPQMKDLKGNFKYDLMECFDKCPNPCDNWDYQPSVSHIRLRANVTNSSTWADVYNVKENTTTAKFQIFFGEMQYMQFEMKPLMNFEEFICNMGGMWGLWSGVSLVGFVQCCYIAVCGRWEPDDDEDDDEKDDGNVMVPPIASGECTPTGLNR